MDLSNPWVLFSGLAVGMIGTAMFIYGKKQEVPRFLLAGGALCILPVLISSLLVLWLTTAGVVAGAVFLPRND